VNRKKTTLQRVNKGIERLGKPLATPLYPWRGDLIAEDIKKGACTRKKGCERIDLMVVLDDKGGQVLGDRAAGLGGR